MRLYLKTCPPAKSKIKPKAFSKKYAVSASHYAGWAIFTYAVEVQ